ncbi:MAG: hypothetical protein J6X94_07170 [Lachnospiraceae bacterium]|nr:hypothetical protein [Lachnospiraceae bacterium]
MNKKFFKILTGLSAITVAGVLSFVPAKAVNAGTITGDNNRIITIRDDNGDIISDLSDTSTNYETSMDLDYLYFTSDGTTQLSEANIYFESANHPSENFTVRFTIPYNVADLSFTYYYNGRQSGPIASYSANGNIISVSGTTYEGYFDAYFDITYSGSAVENPLENLTDKETDDFYDSIKTTTDDIIKAAQEINHDGSENPQKVVFYDYNGAINYRIIKALANTQGVTLLYTFEYKGYVFTSAITSELAAQIFIEGEDWYGPCYIAKYCPTALVGVAL